MDFVITEEFSAKDLEAPLFEKNVSEVHTAISYESNRQGIIIDFKYDATGLAVDRIITKNTHFWAGLLLSICLDVISMVVDFRLAAEENSILKTCKLSFSAFLITGSLLLPPITTVLYLKLKKASVKRTLQCLFDCVYFQFGLFFGFLTVLTIVNLCMISWTATARPVFAYCRSWALVSCYVVATVQVITKQLHRVGIHSIELIPNYDKDTGF